MINNDVFTTIVVMYFLSIIVLVLILIVVVVSLIDFSHDKIFRLSPIKISILGLSFLILYLGLPWWLLSFAYNFKSKDKAELFHKYAITSAVSPSVKAHMYSELGSYYNILKDGPKALEAYEKSIKLKDNDMVLSQLCLLYTIKDDFDNAVDTCVKTNHYQISAVNYIKNKDYKNALVVINTKIYGKQKATCWDYATRAYIYQKMSKKVLYKKDYQRAVKMCPDNRNLYLEKNSLENFYAQKKKEYNF